MRPENRHVRRQDGRTIYHVNLCPSSRNALGTVQNTLLDLVGLKYSFSVILRALALMTAQGVPSTDIDELIQCCRECASRGRKFTKQKEDNHDG